jgi:hypothetical protein
MAVRGSFDTPGMCFSKTAFPFSLSKISPNVESVENAIVASFLD